MDGPRVLARNMPPDRLRSPGYHPRQSPGGECLPCVCALGARESECVLEPVLARSLEVIQDAYQE
eukprot:5468961-Pyramimonas_sp.AAC.1